MLSRSILICRTIDFLPATAFSHLNLLQRRFRRRTMTSPTFILPKHEKIYSSLNEKDRLLMETLLKTERNPVERPHIRRQLPITVNIPDTSKNVYSPELSKRIGLIGRKIGMTLQWLSNGTRVLCTLIHFPENHVIKVFDPETWFKRNPVGKRKSFGKFGPRWNVLVGAGNVDSIFYTDAYRRIFNQINVPIKDVLAGFICTSDAVLQPGTKLDVRHFNIGQYVTVSGKTIDYGFQGVVRRWGMKGQPKLHTTKSHRRVGSIGSKGDARVWPGRKLPGHMGYEWRHAHSLEVLRINPIKQVMYVKGCVPGDLEETLLVKDEMISDLRILDPPFPTFLQTNEAEEFEKNEYESNHLHMITSKDLYSQKLFRFSEPSIQFTEADETKLIARDKSKAKLAKVKK